MTFQELKARFFDFKNFNYNKDEVLRLIHESDLEDKELIDALIYYIQDLGCVQVLKEYVEDAIENLDDPKLKMIFSEELILILAIQKFKTGTLQKLFKILKPKYSYQLEFYLKERN